MNTSEKVTILFQNMIMKRTPLERLFMGFSMYDAAKTIVKSSILADNPKITLQETKEAIFLRFYGMDFNTVNKKKILEALRNKRPE